MYQFFMVLYMIAIIIRCVHEVRQDPTFTRKRVLQCLAAMAFYLAFAVVGIWALIEYVMSYRETRPTDGETALITIALLLWVALDCLILARLPGVKRPVQKS
ncbi:MAG: hypothetical protein EHM61_13720 [Acidobacteria bacterium]|nr:MAG: hypothetical protein EHM61_13720 [Acidobacteriota bacterium]